MNDLIITLLSIDYQTLISRFISTYNNLQNCKCIIFAQGYSENDKNCLSTYLRHYHPNNQITIIYDDAVYRKGLSISEIRDYFLTKYLELFNTKYTFVTDDDTMYDEDSIDKLTESVKLFESDKSLGLISFYTNTRKKPIIGYYDKQNSLTVGMRAGMMYRTNLLLKYKFGGEYKIRYFEESYSATMIYLNGYNILRSRLNATNRATRGGITDTLRNQYNGILLTDVPNSAWEVLETLGYYKFRENRSNCSTQVGELTKLANDKRKESLNALYL